MKASGEPTIGVGSDHHPLPTSASFGDSVLTICFMFVAVPPHPPDLLHLPDIYYIYSCWTGLLPSLAPLLYCRWSRLTLCLPSSVRYDSQALKLAARGQEAVLLGSGFTVSLASFRTPAVTVVRRLIVSGTSSHSCCWDNYPSLCRHY